jgi:hypothetical protein
MLGISNEQKNKIIKYLDPDYPLHPVDDPLFSEEKQ